MESASRFVQFICVSGFCSSLSNASVLLSARLSPLSQFFPPNPSGQSQLKEPHRLTQVPPFRHGLVLQKCLLVEQPGTHVVQNAKKPLINNNNQSASVSGISGNQDQDQNQGFKKGKQVRADLAGCRC